MSFFVRFFCKASWSGLSIPNDLPWFLTRFPAFVSPLSLIFFAGFFFSGSRQNAFVSDARGSSALLLQRRNSIRSLHVDICTHGGRGGAFPYKEDWKCLSNLLVVKKQFWFFWQCSTSKDSQQELVRITPDQVLRKQAAFSFVILCTIVFTVSFPGSFPWLGGGARNELVMVLF